MKKKILYCGEASYLKTGYASYSSELLKRLQATGKYDIVELGSYGHVNAEHDAMIKWKYYPNAVTNNDPRYREYMSNPQNAGGFWRFDRVLLEEKPDIVFSIRDPWVDSFINQSPHRRHFHYVWMPTCDSMPVSPDWLDSYRQADLILGYTDWQLEELKQYGLTNLFKSAPHCPPEIYRPVPDRKAHKAALKLDQNCLIVGTVMRNQKRKLFPDLFKAFSLFLEKCKAEEHPDLADRTYLYLHTTYPDLQCWELPELLHYYELSNKVLFSYRCKACKAPYISFYQDARSVCPHCHQFAGGMTGVGDGYSQNEMMQIYNLFDAYVQYSVAEGFGCPIVESAHCGALPFAVNITAPTDIIKKLNGVPIKVEREFWAIDEKAIRGLPDNQDLANKLYDYLSLPEPMRNLQRQDVIENANKHYTWDKTVDVWMEAFDMFEPKNTWAEPPRIHTKKPIDMNGHQSSQYDFVKDVYTNLWGRPDLVNSYQFASVVSDLTHGLTRPLGGKPMEYKREHLVNYCNYHCDRANEAETLRQLPKLPSEDWIEYAKLKERVNAQ